jgi:membrane protein required for colicin V production
MNWLDIVIVLLLLYALWEGWKQGVVAQILGLAALALGVGAGWWYGPAIGRWMGLDEFWAQAVGFAVVFIAVVLVVVLIGRLTRGVFRIVGLGVFDNLLGVVFSLLKMAIFVRFFILLIGYCDPDGHVIPERVKERSTAYKVVDATNGLIFPFVRDIINGTETR